MSHDEQMIMKLIMHSGDARSLSLKAIDKSNEGLFSEADSLLQQANECMNRALEIQAMLIEREVVEGSVNVSLLMVHAQDHLMNAMTVYDLSKSMIGLIQKISPKPTEVKPLRILLACAGGFSTSMLMDRIRGAAKKMAHPVIVDATSSGRIEKVALEYDVVLLGPQVAHLEAGLKARLHVNHVIVSVISSLDCGMMNGEKVLADTLSLVKLYRFK